MTLEQAIYILDQLMTHDVEHKNDTAATAHRLGLEALERIKELREFLPGPPARLLLGETKE